MLLKVQVESEILVRVIISSLLPSIALEVESED
jgi:hypothetical protein